MVNDKDKKKHDGTENEEKERLMDEQYEFGLNEDVREELEDKNEDNPKHKESDDKADSDDEVIKN